MEAQMDRERLQRTTKDAVDKLEEVEKSRKLLADEFVSLKANYMALAKDYDTEVSDDKLGLWRCSIKSLNYLSKIQTHLMVHSSHNALAHT